MLWEAVHLRHTVDPKSIAAPKCPGSGTAAIAAANARAAAMESCTSEAERMAVRLVEAKDGVMQLVVPLRELPLV